MYSITQNQLKLIIKEQLENYLFKEQEDYPAAPRGYGEEAWRARIDRMREKERIAVDKEEAEEERDRVDAARAEYEEWKAKQRPKHHDPTARVSASTIAPGRADIEARSGIEKWTERGSIPGLEGAEVREPTIFPKGSDPEEKVGAITAMLSQAPGVFSPFKSGEEEELEDFQTSGELGSIVPDAAASSAAKAGAFQAGTTAARVLPPVVAAQLVAELAAVYTQTEGAGPGQEYAARAAKYRGMGEAGLLKVFRNERIARKYSPEMNTKEELIDKFDQIKQFLTKNKAGDIIIRGGGGDYEGQFDPAVYGAGFAREIKLTFLDLRKRLINPDASAVRAAWNTAARSSKAARIKRKLKKLTTPEEMAKIEAAAKSKFLRKLRRTRLSRKGLKAGAERAKEVVQKQQPSERSKTPTWDI